MQETIDLSTDDEEGLGTDDQLLALDQEIEQVAELVYKCSFLCGDLF